MEGRNYFCNNSNNYKKIGKIYIVLDINFLCIFFQNRKCVLLILLRNILALSSSTTELDQLEEWTDLVHTFER